jgi:serine/threonine protein kinase
MAELRLEQSVIDERYEVSARLNRGSYAEIFVARDRAHGMQVVIKALNTSLQGTPDAALEHTLIENFENEARALDAIRHPHVILRWGHGTAADLVGVPFHYLVLEYMPGGDLLRLCRQRPGNALSLSEALHYFQQACEALAYAHRQGFIHRDLKPNNFLLSEDQRILKIADFGVAKLTTGEADEITRVGADVYAPPEHNPDEEITTTTRLTAAADIYSLAKSFYTVVCGRTPKQFKCDPITSLPDELMNEPWGASLLNVLRRATHDAPERRYQTVVEFWHDLAQTAIYQTDEADLDTVIRPRLQVIPGPLPQTPTQARFGQVLNSQPLGTLPYAPGFNAESRAPGFTTAPREAEAARRDIVIDLQQPPRPVARPRPSVPPAPTQNPTPALVQPPSNEPSKLSQVFAHFNASLRSRLFIVLLALALLGGGASIYNYARRNPNGFGAPTQIEVSTNLLNVRARPSARAPKIGDIASGSRHRVLTKNDDGWLQIEVSQWNTMELGAREQNRGWVDGNSENVRVVSRRWW